MGAVGDVWVLNIRDGKHLLVNRLQRIDALLQVDVVWRKLGLSLSQMRSSALAPRREVAVRATNLVFSLAKLLLCVLKGARGKRRDLATQRAAFGSKLAFGLKSRG